MSCVYATSPFSAQPFLLAPSAEANKNGCAENGDVAYTHDILLGVQGPARRMSCVYATSPFSAQPFLLAPSAEASSGPAPSQLSPGKLLTSSATSLPCCKDKKISPRR